MTINLSAHVENLLALHRADLLIRDTWTGTHADGRGTVCMLAALSPETGVARSASACPAEVMPKWLAHLTPWFSVAGTDAAWPAMVKRFADLVSRWHVLTAKDWRRLKFAARAICVREAGAHAQSAEVIAICNRVAVLCDRAAAGNEPAAKKWLAAKAAAAAIAATQAAVAKAAWAAGAAGAATLVGVESAVLAASWAAADAGGEAAADRMTVSIFAAIETRIAARTVD